jgi:hypothetical protein
MRDDARAIENLVYAYAERIDGGDLGGVADLFAHGRIEAAPGFFVEGSEQVRGLYDGSTRIYDDGTPRTKHLTTNVIVEVDDDTRTATARSYFTVFQQTDVLALQPIISGRYHDTFHVVEGRWRFDTRRMFVDLKGDLSQHLLFNL